MQPDDDEVVHPHPHRQDTFDLRDQLMADEHHNQHLGDTYPSDEEHSVLEDDSDAEERDDYMEDDDGSSSLSIPNESIDFDLVYALHSFAATVEGQANVVKGDSLFLMDDSNSYWWLVRVLKTQEVGYIPAENIETPFERLARLNKHRNVDLASATHTERQESVDHIRDNLSSRAGSNQATPSPTPGAVRATSRNRARHTRGVAFTPSLSVHRYPPAVWGDEEEDDDDISWDDEGYEDEDPELAEEQEQERERAMAAGGATRGMEPDDGMSWEDGAVEDMQARKQATVAQGSQAILPGAEKETAQKIALAIPPMLQPGPQQQPQPQREGAAQASAEQSQQQPVAAQPPRDRVAIVEESPATVVPVVKSMDPVQAKDTRKISITPPVARDSRAEPQQAGPLLPSAIMQQQHDDRKRTREEIEALGDAARKKVNQGKPTTSTTPTPQAKAQGGAKLRKPEPVITEDDSSKDRKKKSGGVFGGLFGRRKDKGKDKSSPSSGSDSGSGLGAGGSTEIIVGRGSEESGRSSSQQHSGLVAVQSSEQVSLSAPRPPQAQAQQVQIIPIDPQTQRQPQQTRSQDPPPSALQSQLSQHASQLRQRDQQQQALYQQYLNRSPATPPEAQPSYGLQSVSAIMPATISLSSSSSGTGGLATPSSKPRPGSLVLSPTAMDGQGVGLPDLSVVRVFAGDNLQTEATFKTVLLNSSTTASDLVRQAIQRFRLPSGENETDYYLTIKQLEGSSAELLPHEQPLGVFETLVETALELPKVKRSSVGSISSVASNLSMHPAIKKLSMNDFTDDSAVKFYLNRKSSAKNASLLANEGEETLLESPRQEDLELPRSPGQLFAAGTGVTPERFSSPSYKFALQLHIHPEDLPDDMVFDPLTEAIVFKNTLRDRSHASVTSSSSGVSQIKRKKIFAFPKNVTVAEVIELGLERFGIVDGVVDGGDEVEDKLTKRRSSSRVRYGLTVDTGNGRERELHPSSKVIDAYIRPPTYRAAERRPNDAKRRSVDSAQLLLGSAEDVGPGDPVFTLRRAVTYRTSRHRSSAPLDEIALQNLHRESMSNSSVASESTTGPSEDPRQRQLSKQEIIAAQRAATRATQRAILSAQTNSARGLDVRLPTNAIIRSSRYEMDDRMRYSYVEPDGETTYDISDIVEEEWRERSDAGGDLLHGVLSRGKDGLGARLDRVLNKIRNEKGAPVKAQTESGPEPASSRSATPNANANHLRSLSSGGSAFGHRGATPSGHQPKGSIGSIGHRTTTPTQSRPAHGRQGSTASAGSGLHSPSSISSKSQGHHERQRLYIPKDYFEHKELMAVITSRAGYRPQPELPPLDAVDDLLFGREIDIQSIHPQVREIYSGVYKQLEEMDTALDELLKHVAHAF